LLIGFGVHGNEWGTLPAAVALAHHLTAGQVVTHGPVSLLLGNLDALRNDTRFVEEDLNRVFSFDQAAQSLERRRAVQLRPLLEDADFFLDLHQTQTPTESAFWTFPWSNELAAWARVIGAAPRGLVRAPGGAFAPGRKCLDEYVRDRGKCGITVEMGEKGASVEQARAAYQAVLRLIHAYDECAGGETSPEQLAERMPAIDWYQTVEVLSPPEKTSRLRSGFACFTAVKKGEVLSQPGQVPLIAAQSGVLLFPKYPAAGEEAPPELVRLATPVFNPHEVYA
jgi:succinylglutamate desuccinylase